MLDKSQLKDMGKVYIKTCRKILEKNNCCHGKACYNCPILEDSEYCERVNYHNDLSPIRGYLQEYDKTKQEDK